MAIDSSFERALSAEIANGTENRRPFTGAVCKSGRDDGSAGHPKTEAARGRGPRNRERVLEVAKAVFSQGGPEASLEVVARRAGVGIGTLYRHFPTREALYEAVYRREVEQLVELAKHLEVETAPVEALRRWLRNLWPRKRAWRRRSPWPRTVPRSLWPTRSIG